jgi:DNA-binding CsgD family transcriptional regulator
LNSLRFAFGAPTFGSGNPVRYSVLLEGLDKNWSAWNGQTLLDYAHLPAGTYTFKVRARNSAGVESPVAAFHFRIRPPWYAGFWAYVAYILAVIAGISALFFRQQRKFETEKAELASEHLQESAAQRQRMQQHEQEIIRLQKEKLESEVQHKNKELALATMHLVQKGEILTSLQEELDKILQKKVDGQTLRQELQRILRVLQYDAQIADDWEQFAYHFDAVYGDFLKRLRDQFPGLSPNDYRLCAYLRMNLSTKEIAHLMNISIRGVEGARYRLRKKLNLPNEDNLVAFLMET